MQTTILTLQQSLPLTCTRSGSCCYGNKVLLNPWELFCLAEGKKMTPREFRDLYTDFGGIQLKFDGQKNSNNKPACSQYLKDFGCSVHSSRPLACRLFPLGRQIQNNRIHIIHEGVKFPCIVECSEVLKLPHLTVDAYLKGQQTDQFEKAQDQYLELMQNLADLSFEMLLDTGLSESGDPKTVQIWRKMGIVAPDVLSSNIGQEWMDILFIPKISTSINNASSFVRQHTDLLQNKTQAQFGSLGSHQEFHEASVLIMGLAIQLARCIGANPKNLVDDWCETAKKLGAKE